jgi:drug/metabolite transporter (DMT)-like permease
VTGILLALSAALGFAVSAVFARVALRQMRVTTGTLFSMVVGAAVVLVIALALHPKAFVQVGIIGFLWILLYSFLNFPVGRLFNFTGVQLVGASRASTIIASSPLFTMVLAVTIGGESVNLAIVLGTLAVIAGCGLIVSQR